MTGPHGQTVHGSSAAKAPKRSVLLRLDNFNRECARAGLTSQASIYTALGIGEVSLWRAVTTRRVSSDFIVAALTVLYRARFDDLFEISSP